MQPSGRLPGVMIYPSSCGTGTWPKHVCCSLCSYFSSHFIPCSHHPLPRRGSATQGWPAEGLQAAGRWQAPGALGWAPGPRPLPFWALPPQAPALCCNTCFKPCLLSKNPSPTPRCQPLGCHLPFLTSGSQVGKGPAEINWPSFVLPGRTVLLTVCLPCHI